MRIVRILRSAICTLFAVVLVTLSFPPAQAGEVTAKGAADAIAWGIDVSAWQGNIDWNAVKASGVQFVFIKCGGTIYGFDDHFAQNMAGAKAAGIKTGVYIYSYATNVMDGLIEAQWILNAVAPYVVEMPLVLDIENKRQKALDPLTNAMICNLFCQAVEAAGYYPMVYSNRNMFKNTIGEFGYDKWVAQWADYCYDETAAFWQVSDQGVIPGIKGHVDLDIQFKDLSQYLVPNGFITRDGFTYYYVNYRRQNATFAVVDGNTYYLDPFGHLIAGMLYPVGDFIYYFDTTGIMQKGFVTLADGTRYFDEEGRMLTGWQTLAGNTYFLDPALGGAMYKGFISDGINSYYLGVDGILQKGLFTANGSIFYADGNGRIQTGLVNIQGINFYFDPAKGGALMIADTATDAAGHVYVSDATGLAVMIK